MRYWLLKSEPHAYSWDDLKRDKTTAWDGVRNYLARNNLKLMKKNDLAFFFHSGRQPEVVGIVQITKEYYPDPTDESGKFVAVDVTFAHDVARPLSLREIKGHHILQSMIMVKMSRLSVSEVTSEEYSVILSICGTL